MKNTNSVNTPAFYSSKDLNKTIGICNFIRTGKEQSAIMSDTLWHDAVTVFARFDNGRETVHSLASSRFGYTVQDTDKTVDEILNSDIAPITCAELEAHGFVCPKRKNGTCTCMSPAVVHKKNLTTDDLEDILNTFPKSSDKLINAETAHDFIQTYLSDISVPIAKEFIKTKVKERFDFTATTANEFAKEIGNPKSIDDKMPWYSIQNGKTAFSAGILADNLKTREHFIYNGTELRRYNKGVYEEAEDYLVKSMIQENMMLSDSRTGQINDTIDQLKAISAIDRTLLDTEPYFINLQNGIYDAKNKQFISHSPDYLLTSQFPASYDPDANCPRFEQYLSEVLDETQIPLVQEILGYLLVRETKAQKSFVLIGEGCNGKSVFLEVIRRALIGETNTSSCSLQSLSERFQIAQLVGKYVNIFADLPKNPIEDNGIFKALVGQDAITVEKKHCNPYQYYPFARLLFSCNSLPENRGDKSDGFYRRFIIIRFRKKISEEKKDRDLVKKLCDEKNGIFNFALEGLMRLTENNFKFSETDEQKKELEAYKTVSDSTISFVNDICVCEKTATVNHTTLYERYKRFCEDNNICTVSKPSFEDNLKRNFGIEKGKNSKGTERVYKGIRMRNRDELIDKSDEETAPVGTTETTVGIIPTTLFGELEPIVVEDDYSDIPF